LLRNVPSKSYWPNTYDSRMMLSNIPKYGHGLGSELLPAAPLTTNYTTNFLTEPFSVSTQTGISNMIVCNTGSLVTSGLSSSQGSVNACRCPERTGSR
jgi:hypothetical protein